jgi:NAD(P)-dependent dehydrogenase (short-subunit alcohol dehydrogenase family)
LARVFVTGSSDGLRKMAGELLVEQGHKVVLHARSNARADETRKMVPGASSRHAVWVPTTALRQGRSFAKYYASVHCVGV